MYQMHFNYTGHEDFGRFLAQVREGMSGSPSSKPIFHFFSNTSERALIEDAVAKLEEVFPGAPYLGSTTYGNIGDGGFVAGDRPTLTVAVNVFEDPDTRMEVHQLPLDHEHQGATAQAMLKLIAERPWVKAVEMLATIVDVSMGRFRLELSTMRDDIALFGGAAMASEDIDLYAGRPFVCSSAGEPDGHAIAFALYGGSRFHAATQTVIGWHPFGIPLKITKSKGPTLYELDGQPAFERYHHYLSIDNDENFAERSLIFPLMIEDGDYRVIKAPLKVEEDGAIVLTSDLASFHNQCRIAYGDPATILKSIKTAAQSLQAFSPQGILAFSCAARHMYWGPEYVSCETLPFQGVAPTAGFYTGGEFARDAQRVLHHNVTLVVAGMREGDAHAERSKDVAISESGFSRQMTIVHSLAAFVSVMSTELQEAYDRMEQLARVDGLTDIWNRHETEKRIAAALEAESGAFGEPSVIMFDIDNFKVINDAYGHKAGDDVIRGIGALLRSHAERITGAAAGRWGGEEFMVLLPGASLEEAADLAQRICDEFAQIDFPASGLHTVSVGVARALPGETTDLLCQRVDKALYDAKKNGKNCVVVA